ncbi:TRAP transporter small permease [Mesorhizobium sp. CAU 1741]|uniref:TRAP transporter small permease n=1 Tax=Mesorhizobium sp. CAU 1741 TaxID=3140366 RepID=UPI00325BF96D
MSILRAVTRVLDAAVWVIYALSALMMALLVIFAGWQVWGRYVLNSSPTWTEQAALLLILYISLPLAAVGIRQKFHLAVEMFPDILSPRWRYWQEVLVLLGLGFYGWVMADAGIELMTRTAAQTIPLIGWSRAYTYLPLAISGVLTVIFVAEKVAWAIAEPKRASEPQSAPFSL